MHIRSILAIARKDALDILLNKSTLTILLTPIFLAVLFVVISRLLGGHTTNALVYNPARSGVEQVIDGAFSDIKVTYTNSPADVAAAFGPDGSHKNTTYALGLVVPADFDTNLRAGAHPPLNLFVDGGQINNQQRQLLQSALADYSRSAANPQPPANITVATVNPPSPTNNALQDIGQIYALAVMLSSFLVGTTLVPVFAGGRKRKENLAHADGLTCFLRRCGIRQVTGWPGLSAKPGLNSPGHHRRLHWTGSTGVTLCAAWLALQRFSWATDWQHLPDDDYHGRFFRDDFLHLHIAGFLRRIIRAVTGE